MILRIAYSGPTTHISMIIHRDIFTVKDRTVVDDGCFETFITVVIHQVTDIHSRSCHLKGFEMGSGQFIRIFMFNLFQRFITSDGTGIVYKLRRL